MAQRDTLYRMFGPKIIEALAEVIRDEINILRAQHGLADRTIVQLANAIEAKLAGLSGYDWSDE